MAEIPSLDKFWKPALAVGGVSTIGAFIFYSLYKQWLKLEIFSKLTPNHTFIIMLLFLSFVFLIAISMLFAWFFDRTKKNPTNEKSSITYEIPESWTFEQAVYALSSEDNSVAEFKGFSSSSLKIELKPQTITANSTSRGIELIKSLGKSTIPNYRVEKQDGKYIISAIKGG